MKAELFEVILSLNNLKLILNNVFKSNDIEFSDLTVVQPENGAFYRQFLFNTFNGFIFPILCE